MQTAAIRRDVLTCERMTLDRCWGIPPVTRPAPPGTSRVSTVASVEAGAACNVTPDAHRTVGDSVVEYSPTVYAQPISRAMSKTSSGPATSKARTSSNTSIAMWRGWGWTAELMATA